MNRNKKMRAATALAILGSAILVSGCGKKNNNPPGGVTAPVTGLPGTPGVPGGCVPISAQIPFTANNIYFSWANIVGGVLPGTPQPIGQVMIGGGSGGGQFQRTGVDGTITMNIMPGNMQFNGQYPTGYPNSIYPGTIPSQYPTTYPGGSYGFGFGGTGGFGVTPQMANGTGMLMISPATQQDILNHAMMGAFGALPGLQNPQYPAYPGGTYPGGTYPGGTYPGGTYPGGTYPGGTYPGGAYPGYGAYPQMNSVCVSQISFNLGHYNGLIYGGRVYLYLNGTQSGYVLYF